MHATSLVPPPSHLAGRCATGSDDAALESSAGDIAYTNLPYITDAGASCGANFNGLGPDAGITIVGGHEFADDRDRPIPGHGMDRRLRLGDWRQVRVERRDDQRFIGLVPLRGSAAVEYRDDELRTRY